jgi:hypothetical protein
MTACIVTFATIQATTLVQTTINWIFFGAFGQTVFSNKTCWTGTSSANLKQYNLIETNIFTY